MNGIDLDSIINSINRVNRETPHNASLSYGGSLAVFASFNDTPPFDGKLFNKINTKEEATKAIEYLDNIEQKYEEEKEKEIKYHEEQIELIKRQ